MTPYTVFLNKPPRQLMTLLNLGNHPRADRYLRFDDGNLHPWGQKICLKLKKFVEIQYPKVLLFLPSILSTIRLLLFPIVLVGCISPVKESRVIARNEVSVVSERVQGVGDLWVSGLDVAGYGAGCGLVVVAVVTGCSCCARVRCARCGRC